MSDPLFSEGDMFATLESQKRVARTFVDSLTPAQVTAATDEELVNHVVDRFRIEPLVIHGDRAEAEHKEVDIDVSRDSRYGVFDEDEPCLAKGNQITVRIPFTGEPDLFKVHPSMITPNRPCGRVRQLGDANGEVIITAVLPAADGAEAFNRAIAAEIRQLQDWAGFSKADVDQFNAELPRLARQFVTDRRAHLKKQDELLSKLIIPLNKTTDLPTPLALPKRVIKPLPPARHVEQEYAISAQDYEFVLEVIRHQVRSFEETPAAFRKLEEEELRDVMLATLNTHFGGEAGGERFRRNGKTDISIEFSNRAAFVAECKIWGGPKLVQEGIDQLLGYLTWRDCRAALIFLNKTVKGFKALQDAMRQLLGTHRLFIRNESGAQNGEWRAVFKAKGDEARLITIHVFLVDLFTDKGGGSNG